METDFEQFEDPPRIALLLGALPSPVLRRRAQDSIARVLRGLYDEDLAWFDQEDRRILRRSLARSKPEVDAEFLIEVARLLVRLGETAALPDLNRLADRASLRRIVATPLLYREPKLIIRSFEGSYREEHDMRRVRSAATNACEQLRRLSEMPERSTNLLMPAIKPAQEELLQPVSSPAPPDQLLRPESGTVE